MKKKNVFHHFERAFNEESNTNFFRGETPTLKIHMEIVEIVQ